ncbi:NAD-dependent epimerase/dehydratase family protein [Zoogloea sp.]|uniref:NAD-dependent epimerase/dehydratase family protein n=1 Tax=Zoogloea sp. TaxID=49181 RepID=UPI0014169693|nr:MAG: NAD-dependent epimerase/dehydratase family protein [Zoogloea sp.]
MTGRVLVSGGRGFIGSRLVADLRKEGADVRVMTRGRPGPAEVQAELTRPETLAAACEGVEAVYHCAGHAHAFSCLAAEEEARHWRVNFEGTRALAEAAGQAGVRRFVFISSVKAQAEPGGSCVDEDAPGAPDSAYGRAKRAAEEAVLEAGRRYGMRVVNLRPAMVFGAGGRGNLERMAALVRRGVFPPLPETGNQRSMVHVDDLVAAMRLVAADPRAAGRTYIIAHPHAPSGRWLYDALRQAGGLPPVRWAVPRPVLAAAARCGDVLETLGRRRLPLDSEALGRLLGSACYSPRRIDRELGWRAVVSLEAGLREMLHGR